jgi:hypothetical protein
MYVYIYMYVYIHIYICVDVYVCDYICLCVIDIYVRIHKEQFTCI